MTKYRRRPIVRRFKRQRTKRGRDIRVAVVERRERKRPERKARRMRPIRRNVR